MADVLVLYYSRTGNTELLARAIAEAVSEENLNVVCKDVEHAHVDELLAVDGIAIGSPTYYGTPAAEVKRFLDDSVIHHGKLDGKVGAAFASADVTGHETTVIGILQALLVHGMIVQGDPAGYHYGVTCLGKPGEADLQICKRFGRRFARLVRQVCSQPG